jgi:hypothetical protein
MDVLYDTRNFHPLDRYECYRAGAAAEFAPVAVDGPPLPDLLAVMSMSQVGDFTIELVTGRATAPVVARRTERLIRACDPECYRVFVTVNAEVRMEQAGHQVRIRERDIGLFDLSLPWRATHPVETPMRVIMLTFPRALVPIRGSSIRPLLGTTVPRRLPGRSLIAQTLIELTTTGTEVPAELYHPDVLQECTVGLIRHWLGQPAGISPQTRQLLYRSRVLAIIRGHLDNPTLRPARIAKDRTHLAPIPAQDLPGRRTPADATGQAHASGGMPPPPARPGTPRHSDQGHHLRVRLPAPGSIRPRFQADVRHLSSRHTPAGREPAMTATYPLPDGGLRRVRGAFRRVADVAMAAAPEWLNAIPGVGGLLRALLVTVELARRPPAPRGPSTDRPIDLIRTLSERHPIIVLMYVRVQSGATVVTGVDRLVRSDQPPTTTAQRPNRTDPAINSGATRVAP